MLTSKSSSAGGATIPQRTVTCVNPVEGRVNVNGEMDMSHFRKKPVVIEAVQFTYPPTPEILAFAGAAIRNVRKARHPAAKGELDIVTLEDGSDARAKHVATEGDWIIKGVQGEFYPCKPDIFEATYEPA